MYRFSYSEILEDAPEVGRDRERAAFDRALTLLRDVEARGLSGPERTAAVGFVQELWNVLIADLLEPENALPASLRADLVQIGAWTMQEAGAVLRSPERSLAALIEVNTSIRDGLR
ncbi:flagellar biosynthesis regulator FlaF [Methylobacterium indicum]|uniref:Flagellar biosynthesis regulator FlaF n=1 Tax=Methylobacterium indicum TaxID=1775910 RepID=A0A0J6RRL8_9HYPH|nr:flagellar biosynthesis regulator FlaF [Methylobacterium indicum]KMO19770.1 flagellar biosynthesis regulator FlaF [Methylobacterium indicum]KMO25520.1 flagellar biosynthesis regulator FlaF [Methylobacterium indicum]KTS32368.1 flagellar biosynthesis regulator FlaF [Methylobacterium indicum]KTS40604.1 flagellar biosynthesis regulator FlaF [Methylobacterium indicum]KTS52889.1 flagellar biosynthesis regulator FlaF [Methylobacterium indicum]